MLEVLDDSSEALELHFLRSYRQRLAICWDVFCLKHTFSVAMYLDEELASPNLPNCITLSIVSDTWLMYVTNGAAVSLVDIGAYT